MKAHRRSWKIGIAWICLFVLCGCGSQEVADDSTVIESVLDSVPYGTLFASSEEITYDVPKSLPGVIVDLDGYEPDAEKNVIFCGKDLSEIFYVVDATTGLEVYAGLIKSSGEVTTDGRMLYQGNFTEVTTPGTYYIKTDIIGRSYNFTIRENLYQDQMQSLCCMLYTMRCGDTIIGVTTAHDACHMTQTALMLEDGTALDVSGGWHTDGQYNKDMINASGIVMNLLMAYELNPTAFTDNYGLNYSNNGIPDLLDEIAYETTWMQRMQDTSGGVSAGVLVQNATNYENPDSDEGTMQIEEITVNATAAYVVAMSRFGGIYKDFDPTYADQCLYQAELGYRYLSSLTYADPEAVAPEVWFMVNAELFKTTGKQSYHTVIKRIIPSPDAVMTNVEGEGIMNPINPVFYGNYAYLTTSKYAKVDLCTAMMENLMDEAKAFSEEASNNPYLVDSDTYSIADNTKILNKMQVLTYVNYLITNKEYRTIIQEHMHYLMGRNPQSISYLTEYGVMTDMSDEEYYCLEYQDELYYDSVIILILSNINNAYEI